MTSAPFLVTGATGRVGGAILRELLAAGAPARAAVRDPAKAKVPPGAEPVALDLADPATFGPALDGVERLFLLWPPGTNATRDLPPFVDAAKAAGAKQVVFLSISGAEKIGVVPHRSVERLLERSGLAWVFLRPTYFMQNLSTVHRDDIRLRDRISLPAGRGRTSFIDVRDVGAVGALALLEGHENVAHTLTGGAALTFDEVADILGVVLARRIVYHSPNPLVFVREERAHGTSLGMALFMTVEYTAARLGFADPLTDDVRRLLGRPPTSFRAFAEDERAAWVR